MSNILIIKHGSLGDLIQANGAIRDIKESNKNTTDPLHPFPKVTILSTNFASENIPKISEASGSEAYVPSTKSEFALTK